MNTVLYDSKYHSNVVRNLRVLYAATYENEDLEHLTDTEVWDIHDEWSLSCETDGELMDVYHSNYNKDVM